MKLPVSVETPPMEAQSVTELPVGPEWQYEPKWDGFRCLAFKDGNTVELRSKSGQPLGRYFPEVVSALLALDAARFVLDGEIVVPVGRSLSFDALLLRIHPAASRIAKLARETPAHLIVFDLLVDSRGHDLTATPLVERRSALEQFAREQLKSADRIQVSPATTDVAAARRWLAGHAGTDGVIAKRLDLPYMAGDRTGMRKIKRLKTADCVVGGFRYASKGHVIGSLLLGLYSDEGQLDHVGFTSSLSAEQRRELTPKLERLVGGEGFTGRKPGGPSRWSTRRSSEWEPLRPELVVEVQYDHFTNGRFRHGTKFLHWRPEKAPRQCTMDQIRDASGRVPPRSTVTERSTTAERRKSGRARRPHAAKKKSARR